MEDSEVVAIVHCASIDTVNRIASMHTNTLSEF